MAGHTTHPRDNTLMVYLLSVITTALFGPVISLSFARVPGSLSSLSSGKSGWGSIHSYIYQLLLHLYLYLCPPVVCLSLGLGPLICFVVLALPFGLGTL